jgi:hypothetical protein
MAYKMNEANQTHDDNIFTVEVGLRSLKLHQNLSTNTKYKGLFRPINNGKN